MYKTTWRFASWRVAQRAGRSAPREFSHDHSGARNIHAYPRRSRRAQAHREEEHGRIAGLLHLRRSGHRVPKRRSGRSCRHYPQSLGLDGRSRHGHHRGSHGRSLHGRHGILGRIRHGRHGSHGRSLHGRRGRDSHGSHGPRNDLHGRHRIRACRLRIGLLRNGLEAGRHPLVWCEQKQATMQVNKLPNIPRLGGPKYLPGVGVRGRERRAFSIERVRPSSSLPCRPSLAASASSEVMKLTKPKPRDSLV